MLKLHLLRHAQADSALNGEDKDRPLTPHGIEQANMIGKCIGNIDHVLCSDAYRTRMTLEALQINPAQTTFLDSLYNAPTGDIFNAIQSCESTNILVIAHNPGIHMLANMLVGDGENILLEKMSLFYNPGTLSIFDCDIESWADLQPQKNILTDLIIPD